MSKVKLLFPLVVYLFMCSCDAAGRDRFSNHVNKSPVKSIKSPDGDIIDCVHISHQPAFNHPLLKNHTIKMKPTSHPDGIKFDNTEAQSLVNTSKVGTSSPKRHKTLTQLWHNSNEKCPQGTIPIRRTEHNHVHVKTHRLKDSLPDSSGFGPPGHEYAIGYTNGRFYGGKATLNVWNPKVEDSREFSLGQIWLIRQGPDSVGNTVEAGWHVDPAIYGGDTNTRLFIYWTGDGYQKTGCYNVGCPGFIQTNNEIVIGGAISSTSQTGGSQYEMTLLVWKDPKHGDWWLQVDDEIIGYWPTSLFPYLSESASVVEWGGEIINRASNGHHTATQMGSGYFPNQGFKEASYIRNIQTVDESLTFNTPGELYPGVTQSGCYDIDIGINDNWGTYFFFGGPGRNEKCP